MLLTIWSRLRRSSPHPRRRLFRTGRVTSPTSVTVEPSTEAEIIEDRVIGQHHELMPDLLRQPSLIFGAMHVRVIVALTLVRILGQQQATAEQEDSMERRIDTIWTLRGCGPVTSFLTRRGCDGTDQARSCNRGAPGTDRSGNLRLAERHAPRSVQAIGNWHLIRPAWL